MKSCALGTALIGLIGIGCAPASAAEFDCMMDPKRVVAITGPVEALIAHVRVDRGDFVNRGDALVEFDAGVERSTAERDRTPLVLEEGHRPCEIEQDDSRDEPEDHDRSVRPEAAPARERRSVEHQAGAYNGRDGARTTAVVR